MRLGKICDFGYLWWGLERIFRREGPTYCIIIIKATKFSVPHLKIYGKDL